MIKTLTHDMNNISEASIYNFQEILNNVLKVNPKLQANKIFTITKLGIEWLLN